jgi:uncharacterized protein YjbJ (UPF0337 family)
MWRTQVEGQDDKAAGKVKEVAGKVTGDRGLEAEGETEQAGGELKKGAEKVADSAKGAVRGARESS